MGVLTPKESFMYWFVLKERFDEKLEFLNEANAVDLYYDYCVQLLVKSAFNDDSLISYDEFLKQLDDIGYITRTIVYKKSE